LDLPENHSERIERALLSLEGLAIGDASGEMLACNCASARQRVAKGLMCGPWFHTDDTEMALSIFDELQRHGRILPEELALRFSERFRKDPDRGYGAMARNILRAILSGEEWQQASASAFGGCGSMGNGAAMRVAPLGAYFAEEVDTGLRQEAVLSAIVTHSHREGQAGAIAVAVAAAMAWRLRGRPKEDAAVELLHAVYDRTPDGETRTGLRRR